MKEIAAKWIRYHISILTISQPEDNCVAANKRANRAAKEPDAIAGKKIFSAQHLGLVNAIQKEQGQAEFFRGEFRMLI